MFRLSQIIKTLQRSSDQSQPVTSITRAVPKGPVVIWNLIRRCNLTCQHCYSVSADIDFPGELSTAQVFTVMDDLKAFGVPAVILSGGEPLLRDDIYEIGAHANKLGLYTGLSTNGTVIDENNIGRIADVGFDYVGISIDGNREQHDRFRRMEGAYDKSLHAMDLCIDAGIKVGMRFTLTQANRDDLPAMLALMHEHRIDKFYLSHLNYAGRGRRHRRKDAFHETTRDAMELLFEQAWHDAQVAPAREYVTGNNDADGPFLLQWVQQHHPQYTQALEHLLNQWGGNSTGVNIANIDNLGNVHPDTFWWDHTLGNVKEQPFSSIWRDTDDPFVLQLRDVHRPLTGRCGRCQYRSMCNGNSRVRAYTATNNVWGEDPGCYLSYAEIGVTPPVYIARSGTHVH